MKSHGNLSVRRRLSGKDPHAQRAARLRKINGHRASELKVSKPSVSIAVKKLREDGYVEMDNNGHISLTPEGRKIAERIYDRHKVLSALLRKLGVSDETAALDACKMEHVVSDETFSAMCRYVHKSL